MEIKNVGVVGCGLMGSGIAQVSADSGYQTVVHEIDDQILEKGLSAVERFLSQGVRKGKLTEERKKEILGRIRGTTRLTDLRGADLIVEAIVEDLEAKMKLYRALDDVAKQDTIFASNTSSLCITEMASGTRRPGRFVGLHFFNPVPLMKVVEVITTIMTEPIVPDVVIGFARSLGKTPIRAPDRPGFVVNRLLVPYMLDAIRALEEGAGTKEDLDAGMKLGCGHPMGPFELLDFVGLDTTYYIANIMYQEFKEKRFAPPPLLRRMVLAGLLGRKSGKGFYDYT
ncbi:MAG TPA: 3-hydroxybutyryl-CoA dehydrogenase [Vicinamibacteria bacterium]|nr:3-hydroxybutyryl-CoA dehydrogenase [Vicinamibacteria bacterium]